MIKNTRSENVTNNVVDYIKTQFIEGKLPAGSKLPPERKLANDFGISRASVREAISILKTMGILEVRHRSGIFVRGSKTSQHLASPANIQLNALNSQDKVVELIEFLSVIMTSAVSLILSRSTEDDLKTLAVTIGRIDSCIGNGIKGAWFGLEFFISFARLSGNVFFYQTVSNIKGMLLEAIQSIENKIISDDAARSQYMIVLRELAVTITEKDEERVKLMLEKYFNLLKQYCVKIK
ncbi:MAG: FadR/GntR family transcriptional regulator [bacterium]